MDSFHIWYKWSLAWEGVSHVMTFDLDLYLQGHSTLTWKSCPLCNVFSSRSIIVLTWDPIWLNSVGNQEAAGVSSEHRRSSCSSSCQSWTICSHWMNLMVMFSKSAHLACMIPTLAWTNLKCCRPLIKGLFAASVISQDRCWWVYLGDLAWPLDRPSG